jgi:hypothetical protein
VEALAERAAHQQDAVIVGGVVHHRALFDPPGVLLERFPPGSWPGCHAEAAVRAGGRAPLLPASIDVVPV